jgi:hypothetical protein
MNKKITKKCVGSLLASLLLTAWPIALVRADTTSVAKNQSCKASNLTNDPAQLNQTIFIKVKDLIEHEMSLTQLQIEIQSILNTIPTDGQHRGQNSMSLRGFFGNDIFSCRGFA